MALSPAVLDHARQIGRSAPPLTGAQQRIIVRALAPRAGTICPDCGYPLDSASHRIACGTRAQAA